MSLIAVDCIGCGRQPWQEKSAAPGAIHKTKLCGRCQEAEQGRVADHAVRCATCGEIHSKTDLETDNYICRCCGEMVCVKCGCTNSAACDEGCWWISPGVCSTHEGEE